MSIIQELKQRNVFRVAAAYLTGAWLLIEVVQTLFPLYGLSDEAVRLVVTLLTIGFPITLVFSWVFEWTPEGFKLEKDVDRTEAQSHYAGKQLDRTIIVLLALALGYLAFDKFVLEPSREAELVQSTTEAVTERISEFRKAQAADKSIAVLPFRNMNPDPANEYFSDGLTEELIGALAKIKGLHVTARTSSFSFKGTNPDIRDIGKLLNVRTVLEGSVRRDGDQLRISAQLINVEDGFQLWSESYDYELNNVLALQETISRAIVNTLLVQFSPPDSTAKQTVDSEAYELYLKGLYYWAQLNAGGFQKSIEAFKSAIAADPGFAPPHAGLANAYSFAGHFGIMPPRVAFPLSIMEAESALALDPGLAEAHVARGMAWLLYEWDWDRARDSLSLALELAPNASLSHWAYTEYLTAVDQPAALDSALRALSLDPVSLPIMNLVAFAYLGDGMFTEAMQVDEEMIAMNPNFAPPYWNRGIIHMLSGRFDEAIENLSRSVELSGGIPSTLAVMAHAYAKSGDAAQASEVLAELEKQQESPDHGYVSPVLLAYGYEGLGRKEDALAWLEKAVEERDGWLVFLNVFPPFESLRHEPRFTDILRRVGLPDTGPDESPGSE